MPDDIAPEREDELCALFGEPSELARRKALTRLDTHCRDFIGLSPFLVLGTAAAEGPADVSPRGDAPGFVAVLDDRTLLIPDRPGNNRVDSFKNIRDNPHVALIFFVPGVNETLRVNGRARMTTDAALLAPLAAHGKPPKAGIVVEIDEAYLHCAKALIRARLWDPESRVERARLPTLGKMLADQIGGMDVAEADRRVEESYAKRLY